MSQLIDLTGKKYGLLTVVSRKTSTSGYVEWNCICECGKKTVVRGNNLKNGSVKSCGCLKHRKHNTHHLSNTRLYRIWSHIKRRCNDTKSEAYKYYGKRGITICNEWLDFTTFYKWAIDNGYKDGLTIDRIDNNKGYSPDNCRWITRKKQANNRRSCLYFDYQGKTQNLMEWCNELDLDYKLVNSRIKKLGWDFEKAINTPVEVSKRSRKNGRIYTKRNTERCT